MGINIKRRDVFWIKRIILAFIIAILFVFVSFFNLIQFNATFISSEISELNIFKKQISWAILPMLQNSDFKKLNKYCYDFKNEKEFSFRIFDTNKKLIVASNNDSKTKIRKNDSRLSKAKYTIWELYKRSMKDKNLETTKELNINNKKYYLEVSVSEEYVINSIIKAQKNIIFLFIFCLMLLFIYVVQTLYYIRNSFNILEDNIIEISKGNLDTKITTARNSLLDELSSSITTMTYKLKMQIQRLKKLEEYKNDFIQNITHEIKTPITAINSAIEFIEDENCNNVVKKECLEIIKNQTNSINKLVEDILELGEINLAKTQNNKNFEVIDISESINEAIRNQGLIDCKINIIQNCENKVNANKKLFVVMISNLLSNAIKYSQSDKIDILISENGIEIKDYGIGIDKKYQEKIFEKFYRIDKSGSRKMGGSGLGLSIVKNIAELHNWEIDVESEVNQGASFKIIFDDI